MGEGGRSDLVRASSQGSRPLSGTPVATARMQGGEVVRSPSESLSVSYGSEAGRPESRLGLGERPDRYGAHGDTLDLMLDE